ncbi:hypothetical protein [Pseudoxanthomonas sp. PXM01]|uniref:hypothetical protein n=1 Tax=Pseudoxanthomonas sp. PXM01 TaxID=2769295 RepID=UPI00178023BF|nr:hypothetical protein [Pseudoxanthomonas sp. PXM01]MBD9467999.1 hypothetical protein [Pseudoxanthomonas sp. PXM01]
MRKWTVVMVLGLVACTGLGARTGSDAASSASNGAFDGEWAACHGETPPDQCSRYVLLQRGDRVCGTWFHFATGKEYRGRIVARADSSTEARRTHVCGRKSVESNTECEDGWQRIDKPLRLCDGVLSDSTRADGSCFADYQSVPLADDARAALQAEPWMQACLSGEP